MTLSCSSHRRPARRPRWTRPINRRRRVALPVLADRARPFPPRRRDRRRAAPRAPGRRGRLAGASAADRVARTSRRVRPPGVGVSGERVGAHRVGVRRSTTCTRSRRSAGWTRSWSTTSWCSPTSSSEQPYDAWIGDEAWELDYFLHENPGTQARALRLADRLRRLAADARRRCPRGGAHRGLQRRDGRADRAIPAAARSGVVRRQSRRTWCPTSSGPHLPRHPRVDRVSTSTSSAT